MGSLPSPPPAWRIPDDVVHREIDGEVVLLDLAGGIYHGLDEVGARIWQLLAERPTTARLVERLLEEYEVDRGQLERDVESFLGSLEQAGLVQRIPG